MRDACDSDSRCGLACDASARDAKSLAMRVEQCEPLSSGPSGRPGKFFLRFLGDFGPRVANALAIYRIEKPPNPENRRKIGKTKKGKSIFLPIFGLFFSYFLPIFLPLFFFSGFRAFSIL